MRTTPLTRVRIGARAAADVRRQFSARAVAQVAIERLRQATSDSWWDRFLPVGPDSGPADDVPTASSQEQRPTAGPLVNVVLADTGWILERCARELESRLPYVRVASAAEPTAAINYYMNYSAWRGEPAGRKAAFFTHVEERVPEAARRFFDVAREMDVAVAMSDRYADQLRQAGVGRVEVIVPGVDLQRFRPSLRIGVVGRTYHTGRKGEDLVRAVMGTPHIEWHFTGEGWPGPAEMVPADRMPDFYRSMDYILVPADYEGGPMPLLEALASGVEVIAPPIGFVPDYPHIEYETGSADSLRAVLERLTATRLALRSSVERRTWDQWALDHDRVFRSLVEPARVPTPEQVRSRQAGPREDRSLLAANCEAGPRPAKPAGPAGPAGPMVAEAARLRVLLALHAPETRNMMGGPAVRLPAMREALAEFGVEADITTDEACETGGYDLVHVFNVWEPESALRQLRHVQSTGVPVVFSPIYMPLDEVLWAQSALPRAAAGPGGADAIGRRIAETLATARERRVPPPDVVTRTRLSDYPSLVREMLEAADLVIGLSQFELARLAELNNGKERATALVPNGTELEAFRGADPRLFAEKYGVADYVLSVGRIEPRKNQLLLVRALADTGLPIVLVGHTADPAYASLVRQQSGGRLVLTGRLGHRDPLLASAFAGAKAFALPSWAEGAPLGALEAAAAGVPLALSDRSGEREYFGDLASYADPGDPGSIRRAVEEACRRLTEDPEHREKLRALIRRSYTWRHAAEATAVAYRRAIAAHRANRRNSVTAGTTGSAPSDGIRRLEIGSGDEPQDGYEHLDSRPDLPHVEHVCDIRKRLPFPDGHWDELLSRSCLEHVSWREAPAVLAEWARVLKPGGSLDLWVPDLSYLCRRYLAGRPDEALDPALRADATRLLGADDVSTWALLKLFGGQEYPENLHGGAFDFDMLARLLNRAGFTAIERREPVPWTPRRRPPLGRAALGR